MSLGHSFKITPEELKEIFARLQPYLPKNLTRFEGQSYGLHFEFAPFTGREEEPSQPSTYEDQKLNYVSLSENEAEHLLREKAGVVLDKVYEKAREQWRDAAYVADLKDVVGDAPARWKTYQQELKALESAYAYLRMSEAAQEWPSAVSRLIDAQERTKSAGIAFDEIAREISRAHDKHLYADLGHDAALAAAGYPAAREWPIADTRHYGKNSYGTYDTHLPLAERTRRVIEEQDAHVGKVGRLSGAHAGI
ncbi:hypothetical protein [Streptomyces sp. NPDC048442]|uniref:hypothetical protein n=1 Tax=Streptomyces sp. NPDC048442 TaxID=3154823 RepID=UPI003417B419